MQREIKFRGLRTDGKGWVYGYYRRNTFYNKLGDEPVEVYTKHFIGSYDNLNLFDNIFEQVEVIPESVGQFTGLKDKNGIEIYEGDLLKHEDYKGHDSKEWEVIFYSGAFFMAGLPRKIRIYNLGDRLNQIEMTGNIHEKL